MKSLDREFLEQQAVPLEVGREEKLEVLGTGRGAKWRKR
jgi:hypothetical protein